MPLTELGVDKKIGVKDRTFTSVNNGPDAGKFTQFWPQDIALSTYNPLWKALQLQILNFHNSISRKGLLS